MAFDSVTIGLSKNGDAPQAEWRQDLVAANSIVGSLSSSVGVSTYRWRLIGRPEGSAAGGTGPEPCALGTATTCAFTVDIPGTYIVECLVNGGAPDATIIVAGCAILETVLSPDNLPLRLLGPGETSQDIADPLVAQGWLKMLNRWLKLVATQGASGTSDHLVIVAAGKTADTLSARLVSSDGTVIFTINGNQLDLSASATDNPFGLFYLVGDTHLAPTGLTRKAGPLINYYDAALTDTYAPVVAAATPTGDPGLIVLPGGPYRLKLWCFASEACTAYFTVSMGGYLGPGVIATSAAVAIPQGVSYVAFNLYAASTTDYLITDTTQPLVFKLYAKANTGTATLRICDGAETGTRLSVPFAGNHAYTHTINNIDPLPAASTTVPGLVEFDTTDPQPDGTADPGSSGKAAQSDHVHPLTLAVPKRYYFSNVVSDLTDGSPSQHTLFSLSNSGTSYALSPPGGGLGTLLVDGPLGDPGLAIWPAGVVPATIWARVRNPQTGERYHLDCGTAPQDASLGRATTTSGEYAYQTSPWPGIQTPLLTDTFQQYVVPMSVMTSPQVGQTGTGPTDRLRCQLTGTIEGTTPPSGEVFEVLCMGATPSYLDTLFAAPTGGSVINGSGQAIGRGADLTIDAYNAVTLPAAGSSNLFRVNPGSGTGEDNLGAIITPSGWEAGSTIYFQAPTDGGNAINLMGVEGGLPGGRVAILFGSRTYGGEISADEIISLVYDGTQWILPNTQNPLA